MIRHHPNEAALVERYEALYPGAKFRVMLYIEPETEPDEVIRIECYAGQKHTGMSEMHPADMLHAMDPEDVQELMDRMAAEAHVVAVSGHV